MSGSSESDSDSPDSTVKRSKIKDIDVDFRAKAVPQWKMKCVGAWLQSIGYNKYVDKFVDEMIDGESLVTLKSEDLSNLGIKKLGERNKLLAKIAKLKVTGRVTNTESSNTSESGEQSGDGGELVKLTATLKKRVVEISVSQTITLNSLLDKISHEFGQRVKIRVIDEDGEAIAVTDDQELADVLSGEEEVEIQCMKDLKAKSMGGSKTSKSSMSSSSSEEGVKSKKAVSALGGVVDFSIFESLMDGFCAIDEDGVVLAFNGAAEKMFGFAKRKVIGQNVKMLMPDSYAKKHDHYLARYASTGVKHVVDQRRVVMAKSSNGSMFPIELAVTEKTSNGSTYFVGAMKLMTDAAQAASSPGSSLAAASGDAFAGVRKTLNSMQEAAVVISETGRIEVFNDAAGKLFGHTPSAMIGKPVEALMGSPHKENHAFYLSRYVSTGVKRVMGSSRDVQAVHADGTALNLNLALSEEKMSNGDMAFVGLLTPSVKHGAAKNVQETALQAMRKLINSMSVPGVIINDKGVIQAFNKGAEELLGYSLIDVVGRNVNMLMNDADAAKHDEYLATYQRTGVAKVIGKERVLQAKHKNGQLVEIQLSVTEQVDGGKKLWTGMMHLSAARLEAEKKRRMKKTASTSGKDEKSGESSTEKKPPAPTSAAPAPK